MGFLSEEDRGKQKKISESAPPSSYSQQIYAQKRLIF